MTISAFDKMRQNSSSSADRLRQTLEKMQAPTSNQTFANKDENFWQLTINSEKVGGAVIRFLPAPDGETSNFIRYFSHAFQGPTGLWYIENSLSTFDQPDPVSEINRKLWNTGDEHNKQLVRERKRKINYVANVLVLKDPAKPENDGKVFYFRFGPQIFDKIKDCSCVRDELDDRDKKGLLFDPFDLWSGANFKIRSKKKDKWPTFEFSEFDAAGRLFPVADMDNEKAVKESDTMMEDVWRQTRPLYKFIDPDNKDMYKSYDALKARLSKVLVEDIPAIAQTAGKPSESPFKEDDVDDDDEDMKMFQNMKGVE